MLSTTILTASGLIIPLASILSSPILWFGVLIILLGLMVVTYLQLNRVRAGVANLDDMVFEDKERRFGAFFLRKNYLDWVQHRGPNTKPKQLFDLLVLLD